MKRLLRQSKKAKQLVFLKSDLFFPVVYGLQNDLFTCFLALVVVSYNVVSSLWTAGPERV